MKPRRVYVMLEIETDLSLRDLRDKVAWKTGMVHAFDSGVGGPSAHVEVKRAVPDVAKTPEKKEKTK